MGFSERNLWYAKQFYGFYSQEFQLLHQVGAVINYHDDASKGHQLGDLLKLRKDDKSLTVQQSTEKLEFPVILGEIPWRHHVEMEGKI